jgi:hypothetical protein
MCHQRAEVEQLFSGAQLSYEVSGLKLLLQPGEESAEGCSVTNVALDEAGDFRRVFNDLGECDGRHFDDWRRRFDVGRRKSKEATGRSVRQPDFKTLKT